MQKRKYLSKGGRFTLIKSMFSNLLIYFLSLFVIPIRVSLRLEPTQKDFLSGGGALEKKSHLAIWSTAYSKQKTQGHGIRNLSTLNKALVGKWS